MLGAHQTGVIKLSDSRVSYAKLAVQWECSREEVLMESYGLVALGI